MHRNGDVLSVNNCYTLHWGNYRMFIQSGFDTPILRQTSVLHLKFCNEKALVIRCYSSVML